VCSWSAIFHSPLRRGAASAAGCGSVCSEMVRWHLHAPDVAASAVGCGSACSVAGARFTLRVSVLVQLQVAFFLSSGEGRMGFLLTPDASDLVLGTTLAKVLGLGFRGGASAKRRPPCVVISLSVRDFWSVRKSNTSDAEGLDVLAIADANAAGCGSACSIVVPLLRQCEPVASAAGYGSACSYLPDGAPGLDALGARAAGCGSACSTLVGPHVRQTPSVASAAGCGRACSWWLRQAHVLALGVASAAGCGRACSTEAMCRVAGVPHGASAAGCGRACSSFRRLGQGCREYCGMWPRVQCALGTSSTVVSAAGLWQSVQHPCVEDRKLVDAATGAMEGNWHDV